MYLEGSQVEYEIPSETQHFSTKMNIFYLSPDISVQLLPLSKAFHTENKRVDWNQST